MADWSKLKYCASCGKANPNDIMVCLECGAEMVKAEAELHTIRVTNAEKTRQEAIAQQANAPHSVWAAITRFFGVKPAMPSPSRAPAEVLALYLPQLDALKEPAIGLQRTEERGFSKLGGLPCLPPELSWPTWQGKSLAFLCQLELSRVPREHARYKLPASGVLYFFYDQEQSTWGFDPQDEGSWRVLYAPVEAQSCIPSEAPEDIDPYCLYREQFLTFTCIEKLPDIQDDRITALSLTETEADAYIMYQTSPRPFDSHLFGHPSPIQTNDMDLECQLVSHGLYCGNSSGYHDPRAKMLTPGRSEWVLLLQFDTVDDANMMWGDCGMLYFWIRKTDLAEVLFDRVWMILQCS